MKQKWRAYNDLAWVDTVLDSPEDCAEETEGYCQAIIDHSGIKVRTLLHLGCGAGMNDFTFKNHFRVTGVDISRGMLKVARSINPDVTYMHGDMRTVRLPDVFDAVAIPESIGYMVTVGDLRNAIQTAVLHLKPGGVLLIIAHTREEFNNNNFIYTGSRDGIHVTVFENNHILDAGKERYEAVITYLIRRRGKLKVVTDRHVIGLFPHAAWMKLFDEAGLTVVEKKLDNQYDRFIMDQGKYTQTLFICIKPVVQQ